MLNLNIQTPRWFQPLLAPARYKAVWGGRGSGKSHAMAEYIIERCVMAPTQVVCIREVQRSLEMSVKRLLESKIEKFKVGHLFEVQYDRIKAANGGVIVFAGMQNHTADSIKSLEGFDIAWVEEAQSLSQLSLELLRPTLRAPGSEILFTWNPRKATDPVDKFFRGDDPPRNAVVAKANWQDNPWLPDELKTELLYDRKRDYDKYLHTWEGEYESSGEARVFNNWTVEDFTLDRDVVCRLGADWGFANDPTVLVRCAIVGKSLYVDYEAYMVGCEIDQTPDLFDRVPDARRWFITADSSRPETISYMRRHGYPKINGAIKGAKSVEEGIEFLKSFDMIIHPRCENLIRELRDYSYKTDHLTGQVLPILEDKHNHCIAAGVLVTTARGDVPIEQVTLDDKVLTREGWKPVLFADQTDADRKVVAVRTANNEVICTPDHKIFTTNRGFVRADQLTPGDELLERECEQKSLNGRAKSIADTLIASVRQTVTTIGGWASPAPTRCTEMFGKPTTALSLMATTFTTSMVTPATTTSATLSACRPSSTAISTRVAKSGWNDKPSTSPTFAHSPKRGTPRLKAEKFIGALVGWLTPISYQLKSLAIAAAKPFCPTLLVTETGFAPTPASQPTGEAQAWTTKPAHAPHAVPSSSATSTARQKLVPAPVLTVTALPYVEAKVYDLTVQDCHEFVANGILVSNCTDALRYACEGARKAMKANKLPPLKRTKWEPLDAAAGY